MGHKLGSLLGGEQHLEIVITVALHRLPQIQHAGELPNRVEQPDLEASVIVINYDNRYPGRPQ